MTHAYIFPGQGSQTIGMGKALQQNFREAADIFAQINDALSQNLSSLMFDGHLDELTLTQNAQPAIFAVSAAVLAVLHAEHGLDITRAGYVAGHSLGEYSALYAAGVFDLATAARLLRLRGQAMQQAVAVSEGAMAAVLGLEASLLQSVCQQVSTEQSWCTIANHNAPGQIVVSGHANAIERLGLAAKEAGAKRVIPLNVSAPFHCQLMAPAAETMQQALNTTHMQDACVLVVCNIDADAHKDASVLRQKLVQQVTGAVLWQQSIEFMIKQGVTHFIELGVGQILSGLVKRISPQVTTRAVGMPQDIAAFSLL